MEKISINPFAAPEIAAGYEAWYQTIGSKADRQEKFLLKQLLVEFPGAHTLLEVGCGTGHFTRWFDENGLRVVGLDSSRPILEEAKRIGSLCFLQGDALRLPFLSKSFEIVTLITTLEFLPDPLQALSEALRVARQGLILGVLNSQSCLGQHYKREGGQIWDAARFFTPHELKRMIREVGREKTRVAWRTTLLPFYPYPLPFPWGGFIGMAVVLV